MNLATEIALAGLVITALGGLGWLGTLTWHGGRQSQKLDNAINDIKDIKTTQGEHSSAIAGWTHVAALLEEVRHDVKNLMTGKVQPPRRNSGTGA
jgi:hypothetical protein